MSEAQRIAKTLEDAGVRLGSVASDILGLSGRAMPVALIAGERDPDVLAEFARGRLRSKRPVLREALRGRFTAPTPANHAIQAPSAWACNRPAPGRCVRRPAASLGVSNSPPSR